MTTCSILTATGELGKLVCPPLRGGAGSLRRGEEVMADPAEVRSPPTGIRARSSRRGSTNGCGPGVAGGRPGEQIPNPVCARVRDRPRLDPRGPPPDGSIRALQNSCRHRGTKVVVGAAAGLDCLRCPYHGCDTTRRSAGVGGGSATTSDPYCRRPRARPGGGRGVRRIRIRQPRTRAASRSSISRSARRISWRRIAWTRCAPARPHHVPPQLEGGRRRFNEGYHVQALHPQICRGPTTRRSPTNIRHSRALRTMPGARRELRASPGWAPTWRPTRARSSGHVAVSRVRPQDERAVWRNSSPRSAARDHAAGAIQCARRE